MTRKILLVGVSLTILLNVIEIYFVNILFFGFFLMIGVLSIIASEYVKIPKILLITMFLVIISALSKILINLIFDYTTVGESSEIVTLRITLLASILTLITSEILSFISAGIGKLIFRRS